MHPLKNLRAWAGVCALAGGVAVAGGCAPAVTTQQEVQLGRQYAAEINRQLPIVQDAAVHRYVNQLGTSIARSADPRGIQYTFYVVNSSQVNAFAVPGGFIYVNRGLIERTENLAELAGVLAHEIGHVVARHGIEQMQRMQQAEMGVNLAYILLGRQPGTVEQIGLQAGAGAYFASHSRGAENEADALAVQYLAQVGINPAGIPSFFAKLLEEQQRQPSRVEQWFSTHPLTHDRLQNTQSFVQQIPAQQRANMTTNTREYQQFKARLGQLPAPRN